MSGGFWSYKFGGTKVAKVDNQNKHGCRKYLYWHSIGHLKLAKFEHQ